MPAITLPIPVESASADPALFTALAVCHAAGRPELPEVIARHIAAAHRLHALSVEAGTAHRAAEDRNRLRELVEGLRAAAVAGRDVSLEDAAGLTTHAGVIADLRARVGVTTAAAREAARDAAALCSPSTVGPLLARAMERILDEAAEPAAVMSGARGFRWDDPAAVHRQPRPIQAAFFALVELAEHRDHVLTAVVALANTVRGAWRPDVHGVNDARAGRWAIAETGHPVLRLLQAASARNADHEES